MTAQPLSAKNSSFFRADIQGLRAIAVLVVVFCHANIKGFSGGFIGVDIFFVVSGFLISQQLFEEYHRSGKIAIPDFLLRRLRRLLPALALVISVTLLFSLLLALNAGIKTDLESAPFASIWLSNFYFAYANFGYFDTGDTKDLFLHTWSLGVEEQFYLVWPLTIVLLGGLVRHFRKAPTALTIALSSLTVASFCLAEYWVTTKPLYAFYLMPPRMWEFALGALVALFLFQTPNNSRKRVAPLGIGLLVGGLTGITASVYFYSELTPFPGLYALLPVVSTSAIISAGRFVNLRQNPLNFRLLTWVGNRSYSIYLWHWPLLKIAEAHWGLLSTNQTLLVISTTLALSELSYRYVEYPFWQGRLQAKHKTTLYASMVVMAGTLLFSYHSSRALIGHNTLSSRSHMNYISQALAPRTTSYAVRGADVDNWHRDSPVIYQMRCDTWYKSEALTPCTFGKDLEPTKVVLMGDSIGAQWFSLVAGALNEQPAQLIVLTKSACPVVDEPHYYSRVKSEYTVCEKWREHALAYIESIKPSAVILGSAFTYDFSDSQWQQGSKRIWERILNTGASVTVLAPTYEPLSNTLNCVVRQTNQQEPEFSQCEAPQSDTEHERVSSVLSSLAAEYHGVNFLNYSSTICPEGRCKAVTDDQIVVYKGRHHITDSYVRSLIPTKADKLREILLSN